MTDLFPACLAYVLRHEGGYVDCPADRGGPTNYGVTAATLSRWRGEPVSAADVAALRPSEAMAIYRAWFWNALACDKITTPAVAAIILDAAVLFGIGPSAVSAQRALAADPLSLSLSLTIDGHVGPKTIAALNAADPRRFAEKFSEALLARIGDICNARPVDERFRAGWTARVRAYAVINIL